MPIHVLSSQGKEDELPIPVPKSEQDLGECIRFLRKEGYDDSEERVAICLSKFRDSQKVTMDNV
jgi:hypothetical protein